MGVRWVLDSVRWVSDAVSTCSPRHSQTFLQSPQAPGLRTCTCAHVGVWYVPPVEACGLGNRHWSHIGVERVLLTQRMTSPGPHSPNSRVSRCEACVYALVRCMGCVHYTKVRVRQQNRQTQYSQYVALLLQFSVEDSTTIIGNRDKTQCRTGHKGGRAGHM